MKHTWPITAVLLLVFFSSQLIGMAIVNEYIDIKASSGTGRTVVKETYNMTGIAPPEVSNESFSFIPILIAVVIGTVLVLLIIKFKKGNIWKAWFFLSVVITLRIAFAPFIGRFLGKWEMYVTFSLAIILAGLKVFRPNVFIHNLTEVFMYGGIAALFVPILNLWSVLILLAAISAYDMWAVWKSKHMVTMAKFQTESKIFAGFMIPYKPMKLAPVKKQAAVQSVPVKTAILGGGDVAFPLLFTGVILKITADFVPALMITAVTTVALALLFFKGQKDTFYPAMPFISLGCLAGFILAWGIVYGFDFAFIVRAFAFG
jgi:presenilin-like A22 family membrane protease